MTKFEWRKNDEIRMTKVLRGWGDVEDGEMKVKARKVARWVRSVKKNVTGGEEMGF